MSNLNNKPKELNKLQDYTTTGNIHTSDTIIWDVPRTPTDLYTELAEVFELDLTEKQINTLNELFNTGSRDNRLLAAFVFKNFIFKEYDKTK